MEFKYLEEDKNHHLIDHFFQLKITEEDLPFTSVILPIGLTSITYIFGENQFGVQGDSKMPLKDLTISGQFYGGYNFVVDNSGYSFGFSLKPTSLYKILNTDISKFTNKHIPLEKLNKNIFDKINPIFLKYKDDTPKLINSIYTIFNTLDCKEHKNLIYMDKAIDFIIEKEGLITVDELLKTVPFSRKSLENHFKKIIGVTPGKYIRQYRFMKLMRKYESKQIDLKDLLYMFNYYDASHFSKDFKLFMLQTPKSYFKNDFSLLSNYLKE